MVRSSSSSSGRRRRKALQPQVAFSQEQASAQGGGRSSTLKQKKRLLWGAATNTNHGQKDSNSEPRQGAGGRGTLFRNGVPGQRPRHNLFLLKVHWIVQQWNNQPRLQVTYFHSLPQLLAIPSLWIKDSSHNQNQNHVSINELTNIPWSSFCPSNELNEHWPKTISSVLVGLFQVN